MKRPVFSFRPNMKDPNHRKAWEILQLVPEGGKTAYLVNSILRFHEQSVLEETVRRVVREELEGKCLNTEAANQQERKDTIPEEMLDFLSMLQEE